jgi:hypothetical protein
MVLTDEERAEALARYQARLDAHPPTDEQAERFTEPSRSARLRMARDRARRPDTSAPQPDSCDGRPQADAPGHEPGVGSSPSEMSDGGANHP